MTAVLVHLALGLPAATALPELPEISTPVTYYYNGLVAWTWFVSADPVRQYSDTGTLIIDFVCIDTECTGFIDFAGTQGSARCNGVADGFWGGAINLVHEPGPDFCRNANWGVSSDPNTDPPITCDGFAHVFGHRISGGGGGTGPCILM